MTKSFVQNISKQCVIKNLSLGRSQILAPGRGFELMSPQLDPGVESKVLGSRSRALSPSS